MLFFNDFSTDSNIASELWWGNKLVWSDSIGGLFPKRNFQGRGEESRCFPSTTDAGELPHALGRNHVLLSSAFIDTAACHNSNPVLLTQLPSAVHRANCLFTETEDMAALCGMTKRSCRFLDDVCSQVCCCVRVQKHYTNMFTLLQSQLRRGHFHHCYSHNTH